MIAVILTIHVLIVLALIGVVLVQRSDGGALGLGGGGGGGGFMSGRGAANALTRTTAILAAIFFSTSILLAITADTGERDTDIIQDLTGEAVRDPNAPTTADDLLRTLGGDKANVVEPPAAAPELEATPEESVEPAAAEQPTPPTGDEASDENPAPQQ